MDHSLVAFLLRQFPAWLLRASWQGTALAAVILVVQWFVGRRLSARWRHAFWLLVFARLLLPTLPAARCSLYNWLPPQTAAPSPFQARWIAPGNGDGHGESARPARAASAGSPAHAAAPPPVAQPHAPSFGLPDWPCVWLAGALITAAWSLAEHRRMRKRVRRLGAKAPEGIVGEFARLKRELRVRRVELIVSEAVASPCLTGLWKAEVILPVGLERKLSPDDIRLVLLHELAHVRRGDLWLAWLGWLAGALHWFNPAIRLILALARKDREMACDDWVLRFIPDRQAYGMALVRFLESSQESRASTPGTIGIAEGRAALLQRVQRIAAYHRPTFVGSIAGLALLIVLGTLTLTGALDEKPAAAPVALALPPQEVLIQAIAQNDLATAEKALQDGAPLDQEAEYDHKGIVDKNTPLYFAAEQGKLDLVRLFVEHGANVQPGKSTWTNPLEAALRSGYPAVATYLHDHGAAADPLVYAAGSGNLDQVKKLTASGKPKTLNEAAKAAAGCGQVATLEALLGQGAKPADAFQRAASTGAVESMRCLLGHGVDLKAAGYEALGHAAYNDRTAATAFLLGEHVSPNREKQPSDTRFTNIDPPLNQAARVGAVGSAKLLLEAGANPDSVVVTDPGFGSAGDTPLCDACDSDNVEIARLLLDHGAGLETVTSQGFTPVQYAAYSHAPRCLALLIDRGANIKTENPKWKDGIVGFAVVFNGEDADRTDMSTTTARINQCMATMQVLLDHGVDINGTCSEGFSLLSAAISNGQTAWTEMLLRRGAAVNTVDHYGGTPLIRTITSPVKEKRYFAVLEELLAKGADPNLGIDNPIEKEYAMPSALKAAITSQKKEIRRRTTGILLAHGARFSVPAGSDAEKMLLAATTGDVGSIGKLLASGASPNVADRRGWTPLLSAAALGDDETLKVLVAAGADVNARDAMGMNALYFSTQSYPDLASFHLLLDKGASVNVGGSSIYSCPVLYIAINQHDPALLGELLKRGVSPNLLPGDSPNRLEPLEMAVDVLMRDFSDQKRREIVTMLIAAGANRHPKQKGYRVSLLYFPVENDMIEMAKFLLDAGIDPKQDIDGGQALADALERHGSKEMKSLVNAALRRDDKPTK